MQRLHAALLQSHSAYSTDSSAEDRVDDSGGHYVAVSLRHAKSLVALESTLLASPATLAKKHEEDILLDISLNVEVSLRLNLKLNKNLLSADYVLVNASVGRTNSSSEVENLLNAYEAAAGPDVGLRRMAENCYYTGHVVGEDEISIVSVDTCNNGFNGFIYSTLDGRVLELRGIPLGASGIFEHRLYSTTLSGSNNAHQNAQSILEKSKNVKEKLSEPQNLTCGTKDQRLRSEPRRQPEPVKVTANAPQRTLRLLIVSDYDNVLEWGTGIEASIIRIVNHAAALHENLLPGESPRLQLAGVYLSSARRVYLPSQPDSVNADDLLTSFCNWRNLVSSDPSLNATIFSRNDIAHLFTSRPIISGSNAISGYASVGAVCGLEPCGIEYVPFAPKDIFYGTILAHEIGHNLGASHDGTRNSCPNTGSIMQPAFCVNCGTPSLPWSQCSREYVSDYISYGGIACLLTSPSRCGNGVVEENEQCDSGNTVSGSSCCFANCTLRPSARCDDAMGQCCFNCQLRAAGYVCRNSSSLEGRQPCDVRDTCNGSSALCLDASQSNSSSCAVDATDNSGTCNGGICMSRKQFCAQAGFSYNSQCDIGPKYPCLLYCQSGADCVKLKMATVGTTPLYMLAPDFCKCYPNSVDVGSCDDGKCMINGKEVFGGTARRLQLSGTALLLIAAITILVKRIVPGLH